MEYSGRMGGVSRDLDYEHDWPVPGFVGLTVAQAIALANETGVILLDPDAEPMSGRAPERVVRQDPQGRHRRRPATVTVWVARDGAESGLSA